MLEPSEWLSSLVATGICPGRYSTGNAKLSSHGRAEHNWTRGVHNDPVSVWGSCASTTLAGLLRRQEYRQDSIYEYGLGRSKCAANLGYWAFDTMTKRWVACSLWSSLIPNDLGYLEERGISGMLRRLTRLEESLRLLDNN